MAVVSVAPCGRDVEIGFVNYAQIVFIYGVFEKRSGWPWALGALEVSFGGLIVCVSGARPRLLNAGCLWP